MGRPPSSSTTFFRWRPAISATAAPARSEPVSETPWIRGSAITSSIWSLRPGSSGRRRGETGVVDHLLDRLRRLGHWCAGFSRTVLPVTRFGAAKRATW